MTPMNAWGLHASASVLAQNNFGDTESDGIAGPMALLIILLLIVATVLLIRNMNKRLRRLPDHFPGPEDANSPVRPDPADVTAFDTSSERSDSRD